MMRAETVQAAKREAHAYYDFNERGYGRTKSIFNTSQKRINEDRTRLNKTFVMTN